MLQPWKFDESLKTPEVIENLLLLGTFLYHCCCELIDKRLT
jgi:hypothetical protein